MKPVLAIVCLLFLAGDAVGAAQDWPQFRGRQGGVAVDHPALPDSWSETRNVTWTIDIPGRGRSSPVVWGDHGALVWAKPMDAKNTGTDGYFYGGAASPALHEGRIYIVNDNEEGSFAAAFDAKTGAPLWRVARDERSNWSTPYVWQNDRRTEIVTVGSRKVRSYDVDGTLLWELAVGTTLHTPTPFAQRGILYVSSGYFSDPTRPVFAIRPGASGNISLKGEETANAFIVWSQPTASATYPSAMDRALLTGIRLEQLEEVA